MSIVKFYKKGSLANQIQRYDLASNSPSEFGFLKKSAKNLKKLLTFAIRSDIIYKAFSEALYVSGCGAVGSALPWGGRGRKFKSCHSDQNKWTALRCCSTFSFYSAPRPIWYIRRQRLCCLFLFLLKIFSSFYEVDEVSAIDPICRL